MSATTAGRFRPGDRVRVSDRAHDGHHRTPWYIKGREGVVDVYNGPWLNPESRGHGGSGLPKVPVYRVRFEQTALWPSYTGPAHDTLIVDIFEHWLEPAREGA
jgi:nitrile hydratase